MRSDDINWESSTDSSVGRRDAEAEAEAATEAEAVAVVKRPGAAAGWAAGARGGEGTSLNNASAVTTGPVDTAADAAGGRARPGLTDMGGWVFCNWAIRSSKWPISLESSDERPVTNLYASSSSSSSAVREEVVGAAAAVARGGLWVGRGGRPARAGLLLLLLLLLVPPAAAS